LLLVAARLRDLRIVNVFSWAIPLIANGQSQGANLEANLIPAGQTRCAAIIFLRY
jgi:hypothetical protein